MNCSYILRRDLGCFVCQNCGHQDIRQTERECTPEPVINTQQVEKKPCGCGKRRNSQRKAQRRWQRRKNNIKFM